MNLLLTANPCQQVYQATDYEEVSVGAAVTQLTQAKVIKAWRATIKADGGGMIRYRVDGGTPDAATGTPMYDGEQLELSQIDATKFKAFRVGATNLVLRTTYWAA